MVMRVLMPRLSVTMKDGIVVQWLKEEGDTVREGEPLMAIETEKVSYEIEAPTSGVLRKILAKEGDIVPVAEAVAIITAPGEEVPEVEAPPVKLRERIIASPAAKRLAREHAIDLADVKGTGPGGRIVEADVRRLVAEAEAVPQVREVIPLAGIRRVTAERLSKSTQTAAHCTITMEVDMSNAVKLRERVRVSYTDLLVKAVAEALAEHPIMNSSLGVGGIRVFDDINVGVAVDTEKGLVVPVIRNADRKSLKEIASTLRRLVERAREGRLTSEDMAGGTFTLTNLGMFGVDVFTPIINPPETAILGVGRIVERPVVMGNEVTIRPMMQMSLSFDHRVVDGAPASRFLRRVKEILEETTQAGEVT